MTESPSERRSWAEPYKIKMVEPLRMTTRAEREVAIGEAGYNTFLLKREDVYIDLLTDSGTSAMSDRQWAGMMLGDEAYAGSRNFYHLEAAVREVYGYNTSCRRIRAAGAEHILCQCMIKPGEVVPGNMYFTTTRLHQELAGGIFVDVIIDEAHDPASEHPFKGNVDLAKLQHVIDDVGAGDIPYVCIATTVNMAGGQPISPGEPAQGACPDRRLRHPHHPRRHARRGERVLHQVAGARPRRTRSVAEILREICDLTDGCTMSAKKDALVNIGGFLALNDDELFERRPQHGGRVRRPAHLRRHGRARHGGRGHRSARDRRVRSHQGARRPGAYLGRKLQEFGVPIVVPIGGHGVFLDAKAFLPHLDQDATRRRPWPPRSTWSPACAPWNAASSRAGRDPETGGTRCPKLELVRLTIPRRVYTQAHMDRSSTWTAACAPWSAAT